MNFPSQIFFNDTALLVQSSYIKEKLFVAASILYGCGYLFLLWKGAQNNAVAVVSNLLIRQQLDRQLGTTSGWCDREGK